MTDVPPVEDQPGVPPEDLGGFLQLALLAPVTPTSRLLVLLPDRRVAMNAGPLDAAVFEVLAPAIRHVDELASGRWRADVVVASTSWFERGWLPARRVAVRESLEALSHSVGQGTCVLVCGTRRWGWLGDGPRIALRPPADVWRGSASGVFELAGVHPIEMLGSRVVRVSRVATPLSECLNDAGPVALVLQPPGSGERVGLYRRVLANASARLDVEVADANVGVRKIGKTAVFVDAADGRRAIVRLPLSGIARRRALTNASALVRVRDLAALDPDLRRLVPAALGEGVCEDSSTMEECLPGSAFDARQVQVDGDGWEPQAVGFISALHRVTAKRTTMTEDRFAVEVSTALEWIGQHVNVAADRATIANLNRWLRAELVGPAAAGLVARGLRVGQLPLRRRGPDDWRGRLGGVQGARFAGDRPHAMPEPIG